MTPQEGCAGQADVQQAKIESCRHTVARHTVRQATNHTSVAEALFPTLALLSAHNLIFVADSLALVWLRRPPCSDRCREVA